MKYKESDNKPIFRMSKFNRTNVELRKSRGLVIDLFKKGIKNPPIYANSQKNFVSSLRGY